MMENSIKNTPGIVLIDPSGPKRWYVSKPFSNASQELTLPLSQLRLKQARELLL